MALDEDTRRQLREAAEQARAAKKDSDRARDELRALIRKAAKKGSTREIGAEIGMTGVRVHQIIHGKHR